MKAIAGAAPEERKLAAENKGVVLKALVHAADLGNPTRPFEIAKQWGVNIVKEFFDQGDKERALGLEISMLCDRKTTNFAKSQIGFLNFMILPYFSCLESILPKMECMTTNIKNNVEEYKHLVDQYENEMKEGNKSF